MSQISGITVVPSSCVTQIDNIQNFEMFYGDANSLKPELNSWIEEADA